MKLKFAVVFLGLCTPAVFAFSDTVDEPKAVAEGLSPKVRKFLQKEMQLLLEASGTIDAAITEGDSKTVEGLAARMHQSFILKQELTTVDLRELKAVVGERFVARDKAFHAMARELSEAAKAGDTARQRSLFDQMQDTCSACHRAYAPHAPVYE